MVRFYRKLWRSCQGYHGVSLPLEAVAHLGLESGGMVSIDTTIDGKIIITPVKEVQ